VAIQQAHMTVHDKKPIKQSQAVFMAHLMRISGIANVASCFIVFGFLGKDPYNDQIWGSLHYLCLVVGFTILIVYSETVLRPLTAQVAEMQRLAAANNVGGVDLAAIRNIAMSLENTVWELRINAICSTVMNLLMGCVPILLRKASYQMPIGWFLVAFGTLDSLKNLGKRTDKTTPSASSSKGDSSGKNNALTVPAADA
jgi:hypothetical protein